MPPVSTTVGDRKNRPLLRFDTQREVLSLVGGPGAGSIGGSGSGLAIRLDRVLTSPEIAAIAANKTAAAMVGRVVEAAAGRLLDRVRKVSKPTYRTGLFYSAWRAKVGTRGGLKSNIELTNPAPYALYVHRKGTRKTSTVFNVHVKPIAKAIANELIDDLVAVLKRKAVASVLAPLGAR